MIDQETLKVFDELYNDTYQNTLKYVICNCSNIEDVKDIVQNVYLDVLKKLKEDNSSIKNKSYIIGIARNKVKDYYRFHYKTKLISLFSRKDEFSDVDLLDSIPSDIDIGSDFIKKEDLRKVWDFLRKKKVIICKIFYLYYYSNSSIKEISRTLGISESNVKNYLYRTLKELNVLMNNRG